VSALDALADAGLYRELEEQYPHGMSLRRMNARVVRAVVQIMKDRLRDLGLKLYLRVDPIHFQSCNNQGHSVPVPRHIIVKDGDLHWRLNLECAEQFIFLEERVTATARPDGVMRVVNALVSAIKNKVHD
jgi:hypothetical protein